MRYHEPRQQPRHPLTELVPPAIEVDTGYQRQMDYARGWNACRELILKQIERDQKETV